MAEQAIQGASVSSRDRLHPEVSAALHHLSPAPPYAIYRSCPAGEDPPIEQGFAGAPDEGRMSRIQREQIKRSADGQTLDDASQGLPAAG